MHCTWELNQRYVHALEGSYPTQSADSIWESISSMYCWNPMCFIESHREIAWRVLIDSNMAKVARVTAKSSSVGIRGVPPSLMFLMKALTISAWPLFWTRLFLRRGLPVGRGRDTEPRGRPIRRFPVGHRRGFQRHRRQETGPDHRLQPQQPNRGLPE